MLACQHGNVEIAEYLLAQGVDVDEANDQGEWMEGGWTPLLVASRNGHLQLVRYLLSKGASVDAKSNDGWSIVRTACRSGDLALLSELRDEGRVDFEDRNLLLAASSSGRVDVFKVTAPLLPR